MDDVFGMIQSLNQSWKIWPSGSIMFERIKLITIKIDPKSIILYPRQKCLRDGVQLWNHSSKWLNPALSR